MRRTCPVLFGLLLSAAVAAQAQFSYTTNADAISITLTGYIGSDTDLAIPSAIGGLNVTGIGSNVFLGDTNLVSVTIPGGVTSIGDYAFSGCAGLSSVTIPAGVTSIGVAAFAGCAALANAAIPEGVASLGQGAFYGCVTLSSVTIPGSVTNIGMYAFSGCSSLAGVTISNGVISLGQGAFQGCASLNSIVIPVGVTSIGPEAFGECAALASAAIPGSVTNMAIQFQGCANLQSVTIDSGVTSIGAGEFDGMASLTNVTIPGSVMGIGDYAFYGCSNLAGVTMSNGLASIGQETFFGCAGLTSLVIPASVTSVGANAFGYCANLASAAIPGGVTNMGNQFQGCANLQSVTIDSGVTSIAAGEFDNFASLTSVTIPGSVTSIGDYAFYGCSNLAGVTIPGSVTSVGAYAFADCASLASAAIPGGVTNMANQFQGCANLQSVTIDSGVTGIGAGEFDGLASLTSVTIPGTVTSIGDYAFYGCSNLAGVAIPAGVTSVGAYAFGDCASLAGVAIPGSVTNVGNQFQGCANLKSVTIDSGVTSIGAGEFDGVASLTNVTIPGSVTSIGDYAFYGCSNLAGVTISNGVAGIGQEAFYGCASLTSLVIPISVTSIGSGAFAECIALAGAAISGGVTNMANQFQGCANLQSVTIDNGVASIGAGEFDGVASLTNVTIPGSVTSIGDYAFYGCSNLASVTLSSGVTGIGQEAFYGCASLTGLVIPISVTSIGSGAFAECIALAGAAISGGVTNMGNQFQGCANLQSVTIDNGVTSIAAGEFDGVASLTNVTIPGSVTSIGDYAFYGCSNLLSVTIPGSVTGTGEDVFGHCVRLTSATILNGATSIGDLEFYDCSGLARVFIAGSVANIGEGGFYGCGALTAVVFQGRPPAFGAEVFQDDANAMVYYLSGAAGWGATYDGLKTAVVAALSITTQPKSLSGLEGTNVSLSVAAKGTPPLGYQWQFSGSSIPGATNPTLAVHDLQLSNAGSYRVVITNVLQASLTSAVATVTVLAPPSIATQPQSQTELAGADASLSVVAAGTAPLHYQWQFGKTNIHAATDATLAINRLQWTNAGSYQVVITNHYGRATSDVATVTVLAPPFVQAQPRSLSVVLGTNLSLSFGVIGTLPMEYQWQWGGSNLPGATNAALAIQGFQTTNAGSYQVVITNNYGGTTSAVTVLTGVASPLITSQPASQSVVLGSNAAFQVTATGAGKLTYQWKLNGAKLADGSRVSGATTSSLALGSVTAASAGSYEVTVNNSLGSAVSAGATLAVVVPPSITGQPANQEPPPGGIAVFRVKAAGTTLAYQWIFNGAPLPDGGSISGSASNTLTVNTIASNDVGSYRVVVSNSAASVTSSVVQLSLGVEKTKPSVAIVSPQAGSRSSAPVLSGTASDDVRVLNVAYWVTNVNAGVVTTSNGLAALSAGTGSSSNWTIRTALLPGTNILAVQSSNYSGLASPVEKAVFFCEVTTPFRLIVNPEGTGKVTGAASVSVQGNDAPTNGAALNIGEGYTLTADPAANWWLANWLTNSGIAGTNTKLSFIMEPNLVLTANFTNLAAAAARYDGIFYPSPPQAETVTNCGLIENLVLKTNGVYSGKLYLAGTNYPLSGSFSKSGQASETIDRSAAEGGKVTLQLNIPWGSLPRQITGWVRGTNSGGWLSTNLSLCAATTNTDNFPAYTALLPQDTNVADAPASYGYALITNTGSMIALGGALSDGAWFSRSEPVNELNQFPVYASLYGGQGLLLGELSLDTASWGAVPAGSLIWIKPPQQTGLYTGGFAAVLGVEGSPWTNSASALAAFTNEAQLTLSGGALASNLVFTVQLTSSNTLQQLGGPANFISGAINGVNGLLTLDFSDTGGNDITAHGTVLQNTNLGGGFFPGATNAGTILLQP